TWTYNTADGPDDSAGVTITAVDTGDESAVVSFDMTVNNVAPSVTSLTSTAVTVEDAAGDGEVEISGSFFDPGNDTHTVTVNWGDGHVEVVVVDEANQLFSGSHTYANGGHYEISVTIVDSDGAAAAQPSVTQAFVQGVGLVNGTLYLIGTDGDDHVKVRYDSRHDELDVDMKLDEHRRGRRGCHGSHGRRYDVRIRESFDASEIDHIVVFLGAGDDFYDGEVGNDREGNHHGCRHGHRRTDAISQIVFGGSGDDQIFTGIGNDYVDGGSGRDQIHSDDGRDILVGGTGRDKVKGGRGNDLLIGGALETDWENSFDLSAIDSALAEWANGDLADTMDILGNVVDDEERDDLFGDRGRDTCITGRYDRRR
ncbi:MAG: hypothetical protein KDA89_08425, partial [Planctomycetaceae bacterium]|nr:hypothetical protein [Planctomycetaceae bacterium]